MKMIAFIYEMEKEYENGICVGAFQINTVMDLSGYAGYNFILFEKGKAGYDSSLSCDDWYISNDKNHVLLSKSSVNDQGEYRLNLYGDQEYCVCKAIGNLDVFELLQVRKYDTGCLIDALTASCKISDLIAHAVYFLDDLDNFLTNYFVRGLKEYYLSVTCERFSFKPLKGTTPYFYFNGYYYYRKENLLQNKKSFSFRKLFSWN